MKGIDVQYGTKLHDKLKQAVRERVRASESKLSSRYAAWEQAERLFSAYQKPTTDDQLRASERKTGKTQFTTITIPYSYATLLVAHTYWASVFLSRTPVFQFTGRHGESQQKVQAIEALIDYQLTVGEMLVPLYIWLLDTGKYGLGILGNYWADEHSMVTKIEKRPSTFMGVPIPGTEKDRRVRSLVPGYQGNRLFNVRPQDFLPDPRVSVANLQDGEYCGRRVSIGWNTIIKRKKAGIYFNVDRLKHSAVTYNQSRNLNGRYTPTDEVGQTDQLTDYLDSGENKAPSSVECVEMVIELVPSDYSLGASDYPEKWVITLAFNEVVIGVQPLGADHDRFPYFVNTYEFDVYSHSSRGLMEILQPLNNTMDWLFNSHMFNVRKSLNNEWIYDPSKIYEKDLRDTKAGKMVRLRASAYGTDVRTVVTQFPVQDVTRQHLNDIRVLIELFQRVSGVNDNQMGLVNATRKTATEVRSSTNMGINRLKVNAEYGSAMGWAPLATVLVQNSQQEYTSERQLKIVGDLMQGDPQFLAVTRDDIQGFFDFVPVDGTLPVDRFAQATLWKEILTGLVKFPQLAQQYDIGGIFAWVAQLAGLKNISQFKLKPQVVPDATALDEAAKGNLTPIAGTGPTDGGVRQAQTAALGRGAV